MGAYRVGYKDKDTHWSNPAEIPNQIRYFRENETDGAIFFSSRSLRGNSLVLWIRCAGIFSNTPH
jgi:hypothetical protein